MLAAQRAMAEGEYELAAQRLIYARDAEPDNVAVLRLMTLAFWQGRQARAGPRARCVIGRASTGRDPPPIASPRGSTRDIGAVDLAEEAATRAADRGPTDAGAWERLGRLRLRLVDREGRARSAASRKRARAPGADVRELIVQALALEPRLTPSPAG